MKRIEAEIEWMEKKSAVAHANAILHEGAGQWCEVHKMGNAFCPCPVSVLYVHGFEQGFRS